MRRRFPRVDARPITFLTDYGEADGFAGVCRAVIAKIAPKAPVIDLSHGIASYDVRQGALALAGMLPFAAAGVHLAVVDPGVGGSRRAVVVRTAEQERVLVGPDNGLLSLAAERFGGVVEAFDISRSPVRLEPVSDTFHGRDLFAPVAAHAALGTPLVELGEPFDPGSLIRLKLAGPQVIAGRRLTAEVVDVDRFGNVGLWASPENAEKAGLRRGERLRITARGRSGEGVYTATFAEVEVGETLVYVDAVGALSLAVNQGSAATKFELSPGETISLTVM